MSGSIADARTLLPVLASDSASSEICGNVFNGLVKYDKNLNLVGDLAKGWEVLEDGLAIIFHLRDNVRWHDGTPFTARDVEFTYQTLIDPEVRTPYGGDFERVRSLEVIDEHTVKVTYKEPFAPGLASWGMYIMPAHLLKGRDLNTAEFGRRPVGTGPFKFKRWLTQEKIELEANPDYFEGAPWLDRYIYRVIPDSATIFLELQTQGLDTSSLTPLQFSRQTHTDFFRNAYSKFRIPSFSYTYLGYNLEDERFSDIRVRQAFDHAVNKQEIIEMVLLGLGSVSTGPFVPESWAFDQTVRAREFDPGRARELLASAGWKDSDNDRWLDRDGRKFEFSILTNQGNEERLKICQIIQRRLKDIGVSVNVKVVEWSVFLSNYIDTRTFECVLLGWSLSRDPDLYDIWHSSKTRQGEFNFLGYANKEVDALLIEARRTFDQEKRAGYYRRMQRILYEEQPCMFLYVPDGLSALHRRFREVKPEAAGIGYNLIEWWVPAAEQRYRIKER